MKRDWELIRKILVELETLGDTKSYLFPDAVKPYDTQIVSYHIRILGEAGLIQVNHPRGLEVDEWVFIAERLTWQGHDLLDNIREQNMWNKVRRIIREKGIEISVEAIKLAAHMIVQQVFQD